MQPDVGEARPAELSRLERHLREGAFDEARVRCGGVIERELVEMGGVVVFARLQVTPVQPEGGCVRQLGELSRFPACS